MGSGGNATKTKGCSGGSRDVTTRLILSPGLAVPVSGIQRPRSKALSADVIRHRAWGKSILSRHRLF